jgi:hypothetical protein
VTIIGGVDGSGTSLSDEDLKQQFEPAARVYKLSESASQFVALPMLSEKDIVRKLD